MIPNESFKMTWAKHYSEIKDGKIIEIKSPEDEYYNPFDYYNNPNHPNLYLKFIAIDESNPNNIIDFVKNYGFLGLINDVNRTRRSDARYIKLLERHDKERPGISEIFDMVSEINNEYLDSLINSLINEATLNPERILDHLMSFKKIRAEGNKFNYLPLTTTEPNKQDEQPKSLFELYTKALLTPKTEDVSEFVKEIARMRVIIILLEAVNTKDKDSLKTGIDFLDEMNWVETEDELEWRPLPNEYKPIWEIRKEIADTEHLVYWALKSIRREINRQLINVNPILEKHGPFLNEKFYGTWEANSLLSAMYVMLYMDLIGEKAIKKCQNKTCPEWFTIYGNDDRKIYCDSVCARQQAQREYRKRKKSKEVK